MAPAVISAKILGLKIAEPVIRKLAKACTNREACLHVLGFALEALTTVHGMTAEAAIGEARDDIARAKAVRAETKAAEKERA